MPSPIWAMDPIKAASWYFMINVKKNRKNCYREKSGVIVSILLKKQELKSSVGFLG